MRENLAGMIRTGRYSVNAIGPAGTNMELGHLPPLFYRGHRAGCAMTASGQTPAISLRRATHDDAPGILACLQAAFADYRDLYTPAAFLDTVLTPKTLKQRLVNMDVFVALTASGQIVGTSACHLLSPEEGHIRGMAVLPECQGAGIAAQLLERAEAELRRRSCTRITRTLPNRSNARCVFTRNTAFIVPERSPIFSACPCSNTTSLWHQ